MLTSNQIIAESILVLNKFLLLGTVHIVNKIGFKLHDRVIRAAQVGVIQ